MPREDDGDANRAELPALGGIACKATSGDAGIVGTMVALAPGCSTCRVFVRGAELLAALGVRPPIREGRGFCAARALAMILKSVESCSWADGIRGGGGGRGSWTAGGMGMPGSPAPHGFPMFTLMHIGAGAGVGGGGGGATVGGAVLGHGGRDLDRARTCVDTARGCRLRRHHGCTCTRVFDLPRVRSRVGHGDGEALGLHEYDERPSSVGVTGSRTDASPRSRTDSPLLFR